VTHPIDSTLLGYHAGVQLSADARALHHLSLDWSLAATLRGASQGDTTQHYFTIESPRNIIIGLQETNHQQCISRAH
jgi:hypothetical protein